MLSEENTPMTKSCSTILCLSFPKSAKIDVNRLMIFDLANFNIDYYTSIDFDIEEIRLNDEIATCCGS